MTNPNTADEIETALKWRQVQLEAIQDELQAYKDGDQSAEHCLKQINAIVTNALATPPAPADAAAPLTAGKWWYDTLDSTPYHENGELGDLSNMACGPFDTLTAARADQAQRKPAPGKPLSAIETRMLMKLENGKGYQDGSEPATFWKLRDKGLVTFTQNGARNKWVLTDEGRAALASKGETK